MAPAEVGLPVCAALPSKKLRTVDYKDFVADGTGWRNATLAECLPSSGWSEIEDVTEAAGYGSRFFPKVAGRRMIRLGPIFAGLVRSFSRRPRHAVPLAALLQPSLPQASRTDPTRVSVPAVSVLMSVHNGAPWVRDAVTSVPHTAARGPRADRHRRRLDGRDTGRALAAVRDPRLRLERRVREGLTRALIRAIELARAPLLARLDADDVAMPERLALQHEYLDAHPDVGLLGTGAREVDPTGREVAIVRPPVDDASIRRALIRANPFVHSSVVVRRAALDRAGGYDRSFPVAQDYDLWMRLARVTRLANLAEPS